MEITMCRGDIHSLSFHFILNGERYSDTPDDIYFTVKKNYNNRVPIFQKRLSDGTIEYDGNGTYRIQIEPEDTQSLQFGEYDFDIEIVSLPSIKKTFNGKLILEKESTHYYNEEE